MKAKKFAAVASALSVAMLGMTGFANPANAADPCDITGVIYDDCTYTVPTGVTKLSVELAGGGGGEPR